jgi:hypothetical protein
MNNFYRMPRDRSWLPIPHRCHRFTQETMSYTGGDHRAMQASPEGQDGGRGAMSTKRLNAGEQASYRIGAGRPDHHAPPRHLFVTEVIL